MARFKIMMGEKWEYEYDGHKIVVTNLPDRTELIVDDKVQDAKNGICFSADLVGKVDDKSIKASVGGIMGLKCDVFVDHEKLELVKKSEF